MQFSCNCGVTQGEVSNFQVSKLLLIYRIPIQTERNVLQYAACVLLITLSHGLFILQSTILCSWSLQHRLHSCSEKANIGQQIFFLKKGLSISAASLNVVSDSDPALINYSFLIHQVSPLREGYPSAHSCTFKKRLVILLNLLSRS